ncbi:MAG: zinc-binding dehydrogenase [Actinobacteria bacterium]|nr:zinc-binding dehydrogenase [Actinomycetota bacterium]
MEITAAVLRTADGPYRLERVTLDEPAEGEIVVRIVGAGLCHTDQLPRALGMVPIVTGHEGAGVVEAVGPSVERVAVGDHVVCSYDSCGTCAACGRGEPWNCETFLMRNLTGRDVNWATRMHGADGEEIASRWFAQSSLATHALVPERNVVVVDPSLSLELLGPLGCGLLTGAGSVLEALSVRAGERLVVFGAGAVGLAAVMAAAAVGADRIVAVDVQPRRLTLASELGATDTVPGGGDSLGTDLLGVLGGLADVSFDTTGVPVVIQAALGVLRPGGRCGLVGIQHGDLTLDPGALIGKTVTGILEGNSDPHVVIPRLIGLWQDGKFPIERLVQTFPLAAINEAEEASLSGEVIKPVLLPG